MKDYIRNSLGEIKDCTANIAKMSPLEFLKYYPHETIKPWITYVENAKELKNHAKKMLSYFFTVLVQTFAIIFYPITLYFIGVYRVRKARKAVEIHYLLFGSDIDEN